MSSVVRQKLCRGSRKPVRDLGYETAVCPVCGRTMTVGYGLLLPTHEASEPADRPRLGRQV